MEYETKDSSVLNKFINQGSYMDDLNQLKFRNYILNRKKSQENDIHKIHNFNSNNSVENLHFDNQKVFNFSRSVENSMTPRINNQNIFANSLIKHSRPSIEDSDFNSSPISRSMFKNQLLLTPDRNSYNKRLNIVLMARMELALSK